MRRILIVSLLLLTTSAYAEQYKFNPFTNKLDITNDKATEIKVKNTDGFYASPPTVESALTEIGSRLSGSLNHSIQNNSVAVSSYNTTNFIAGNGITLDIVDAANRTNVTITSSAGGGNISGAGANTQVSYFTGANTIAGEAAFTYNATTNVLTTDSLTLTNPLPIAFGGTGAANLDNLIALTSNTTGNYVATVADSGAGEVTVSGSGSENAAVTLAIAAGITRDTEWDTWAEHPALTAANIVLGNATNVPTVTAMSGDINITNAGVTAVQANAVALGTDTTNNYVATVATTAPLTGGAGGSEGATLTIAIPKATTSVDGYLNMTDWGTFNGKQNTLTNSAGLASALSDETGSGKAVFDTSPTFTTSIIIPNGANPTVDSAGKIAVDTSATSGSAIRFYGDATYTLPAWQSKSFVIASPVATDDYSLGSFFANMTIKQIRVLCVGGTNVIGGLDEADANGASPVAVDSDITASAGTTATDDGVLTNPTIAANNMLQWHTTSVSGTPTALTITVYYIYDAVN